MNDKEFAETFAWMSSAFPNREIPKQTWEVYFEFLKDLPADVFRASVATCLARFQFFPSINQIREVASEFHGKLKGLPDAYGAWGVVLEGLKEFAYGDPEVHPLIDQCVKDIGGWKHLSESEMVVADRARFIEVYRERLSRYREEAVVAPPKMITEIAERMSGERKALEDGNDLSG